jgi:cyclic pyranopterin monophosphate synthase
MDDLTHLDAAGHARMVDVSDREVTVRTATAVGLVVTTPEVLNAIATGSVAKGDVAALARVAGILGAKRTPDLVPLCHPIALHGVEVDVEVTDAGVRLTATARTADRTGVEMEALTAIAVAGLTVIDMIKSLDPAARITDVQLEAKDGGRSGSWRREDSA